MKYVFLFSLGGLIGIQLIVQFVISPKSQSLDIYNLFDHIFPYTIVFLVASLISALVLAISFFQKGTL